MKLSNQDRRFLRAMKIEVPSPEPYSRADLLRWLSDQTEATAAAEQDAARWRERYRAMRDVVIGVAVAVLAVAGLWWMR